MPVQQPLDLDERRRLGLGRDRYMVERDAVDLDVAPQVAERALPRLEVAVVGGSVRELRPARVRVRLRGAPDVLDRVDPAGIVPFVDVTGMTATAGAQPVVVRVRGVPEGIELLDVEPADVLASPTR